MPLGTIGVLEMREDRKKLTIPDLAARKQAGERLVMVAVADTLTATWAWRAGVDIVGVGDSLGMTVYGHENTLPYEVGKAVDEAVSIFTFSIGAGGAGSCQLLNGYDLIGAFDKCSRTMAG